MHWIGILRRFGSQEDNITKHIYMKHLKYLSLLLLVAFMACEKEASIKAPYETALSTTHSFVKFVHAYGAATPSYSTPAAGPTLQIEMNMKKITPTALAIGATFPANEYTAVNTSTIPSTTYAIKMSTGTPATTVRDSLLFSFIPQLTAGRYQTYFFFDDADRPAVQAVEDDIRNPAGGNHFRVRFANFIPNPPTATPAIDVFSTNNNAVVLSNIPYRRITSYIELPRTGASDIFRIRWAGTTTVISSLTVTTNNMNSLTLVARGRFGVTGTRAPGLSVTRDR